MTVERDQKKWAEQVDYMLSHVRELLMGYDSQIDSHRNVLDAELPGTFKFGNIETFRFVIDHSKPITDKKVGAG